MQKKNSSMRFHMYLKKETDKQDPTLFVVSDQNKKLSNTDTQIFLSRFQVWNIEILSLAAKIQFFFNLQW